MYKVFIYISILFLTLNVFAGTNKSVTLAWSPSPDSMVTGYNLYQVSLSQTDKYNVGPLLLFTVTNLVKSQPYSYYATAYTANNIESLPSNQVNYTPPNILPTFNLTNLIVLSSPISRFLTFQISDIDSFHGYLSIYTTNWPNIIDNVQIIPFLAFGYTNKILAIKPSIVNFGTNTLDFVLCDEISRITNSITIINKKK